MTSVPVSASGPPLEDQHPDELDDLLAAETSTQAATPAKKRVGPFGALLLILWLVVAALAAFVGILWAYPLAERALTAESVQVATAFGLSFRLTATTATIVVTGLAGAAGSVIRIIQRFAAFMGRGGVERGWVPWYFVTPFAAGLLGSFFGLAVTAGLVALDQDNSAHPRIAVLVTMGALAGLFSENVIDFLAGLVPTGRGQEEEAA